MIGGSSLSHRWYTFFIVIVFLYNKNSKVGNNLTNCYRQQISSSHMRSYCLKCEKKFFFILSQFDWLDFVKKTLPKVQQHWFPKHYRVTGLKTTQQSPHYIDTYFICKSDGSNSSDMGMETGSRQPAALQTYHQKEQQCCFNWLWGPFRGGSRSSGNHSAQAKTAQNHLWRHLTLIREAEIEATVRSNGTMVTFGRLGQNVGTFCSTPKSGTWSCFRWVASL